MGSGDGADGRFIGTCSSHGIFVATLFGWTSGQCVLGCYTGTNSTILVVRVVHFNMSECLLLDLCWGRGGGTVGGETSLLTVPTCWGSVEAEDVVELELPGLTVANIHGSSSSPFIIVPTTV